MVRKLTEEELQKIDPNLKNEHPKDVLIEIYKIDAKKFLYGAGFQKERDLFIGCLFAFYCRKIQGREWYIQRVSDPPDFELTAATDRTIKEKPFDHAEIEIVEITSRVNTLAEAIGVIKSRKIDRHYDLGDSLILLIFLNNANGPHWSDGLIEFFQGSCDKYSQVFAIYLLKAEDPKEFIYEVKSLRPHGSRESLNMREELSKERIRHPLLERFGIKIE